MGAGLGGGHCHSAQLPSPPQLLSKGAFGYLLPIVSFVLAWLETWFLDFKVLPQEAEEERCEWRDGAQDGGSSFWSP